MKYARTFSAMVLLTVYLMACSDSTGPAAQDFEWSGQVAAGDQIEIKGVNGTVRASRTSGSRVEVTARRSGDQDDLSQVEIEVVQHAEGVTICAVYPDVPGEPPNECAPGDLGQMAVRDNDVTVTFTVSVPAGVVFVGATVNGNVEVTDLASDAVLATVNGNVTVSTTRHATAAAVNGSILAAIGLADWDRDLAFATVNGDVAVVIPANTNAEVQVGIVNGSFTSDFTLTQTSPGAWHGTLGTGGRNLSLATVDGDVTLSAGS